MAPSLGFGTILGAGFSPRSTLFPELFRITSNKEAWVRDHMQLPNGVIRWNVPFLQAAQDWEVEVVMAFFGKLYAFVVEWG